MTAKINPMSVQQMREKLKNLAPGTVRDAYARILVCAENGHATAEISDPRMPDVLFCRDCRTFFSRDTQPVFDRPPELDGQPPDWE